MQCHCITSGPRVEQTNYFKNCLMPLFGSFLEIPVADVFALVSKGIGRLRISLYDSGVEYDVQINGGIVTRFTHNKQEVVEDGAALSHIVEFVANGKGEFVFTKTQDPPGPLRLPIEKLLSASEPESAEVGEISPDLPAPETRFLMVLQSVSEVDHSLSGFWDTIKPFLRMGASARDLASATGLPLDRVLLRLHKLRLSGHIRPLRAFESAVHAKTQGSAASSVFAPINGSTALKPNGEIVVEGVPSYFRHAPGNGTASPVAQAQPRARIHLAKPAAATVLVDIQPARPSPNMLGKILAAIRQTTGNVK